MQEYVLIIHPAEEGGYWAEVPALPGCFVQGENVEELLAEAPEIIEAYLAAVQEDGGGIASKESVLLATVRVPTPSAA
jgi:predicted RNase H-like HicB family nuclease